MPANLPATKPKKTKSPQASGTYPGHGKIDFEEAFKLRYKKQCTLGHIAKHFGVTRSAVTQRLKPAADLFRKAKLYPFVKYNESQVEKLASAILLEEMLKPGKLKKASVNNLAYARASLKGSDRQSMDVKIELIFQTAEQEAKQFRRSAADIIINKVED